LTCCCFWSAVRMLGTNLVKLLSIIVIILNGLYVRNCRSRQLISRLGQWYW
jgi:hypothetical protein